MDTTSLAYSLEKDDPLSELKNELLAGADTMRLFRVYRDGEGEMFNKMFAFLRFVHFNGSEEKLKEKVGLTKQTLGEDKFNGEIKGSFSLENECAAIAGLQKVLMAKQKSYDTTLDQDLR